MKCCDYLDSTGHICTSHHVLTHKCTLAKSIHNTYSEHDMVIYKSHCTAVTGVQGRCIAGLQ